MRTLLSVAMLVFLAVPFAASAQNHEPKLIPMAIKRAFVPPGFDDNDRVQIVVSGVFPNSCHKVGPARVEIDEKSRTLRIRQTAYVYRGLCFDMPLPFARVIDLGLLSAGIHDIVDVTGGEKVGSVNIRRATSDASDEALYAPVSDMFPYSDKPGESMLFLAGTFPAKCLKLSKVDVKYHEDVIEILPITELRSKDAEDCRPQPVPFTHRLRLKDGLKGTYLLHLRSMDGQAVNKLTEFPLPPATNP